LRNDEDLQAGSISFVVAGLFCPAGAGQNGRWYKALHDGLGSGL
jgi:hypothetical protein